MSSSTGLYYPYIQPRCNGEIRSSLLFWDQVRRIIPEDVQEGNGAIGDDDETRFLTDEGFLVPTSPEPYLDGARERFMIDEDDNYTYKAGFSSDSSRIHVQKLDPGLRDYLMSIGMAHRDRKWLSINSRLSGFYMYCLATEMSERMNTPLLTDVIGENWGSGQALHFDSFGRDGKYVTETLVSLGIRVPGPQDLQRIPVNIFGKFLHEHRDERTLFRELVIDIMNNLRALEDNNQVRDYLESEKRKLESATENLKKDLEAIGILTVNNIAKITLPAIGASVTALAAPPVAPFVIGAGVFGVGAALCLASSRITDRRQLLLPIRSHAS